MAVEHAALAQALGARRHHILLADFVEEGVLGEKRHGGEAADAQSGQRQHQMPGIVADLARCQCHLVEIVGGEAAQREPAEIAAAGEQHDQHDREDEARNGIADDDDAGGPDIEIGAVLHRLADAERNRDEIGDEGEPQAERDRHRHLLDHQVDDRLVAEIALAEIEGEIVLHHQEEALIAPACRSRTASRAT